MTRKAFFLYVEDNASNRRVIQMLFQKALVEHELAVFEDSANFMERVKALPQRPDVFLLDIHVAPYSGFEMLDMLRSDPGYQDVRAVALTASVTNEEVAQLRQRGFDGAIGKPLRASSFPDLIERILKGESIWQIS